MTFYAWSQGDFHPIDLVGLAPLIPASAVRPLRHANDLGQVLDEAGDTLRAAECSFSGDTVVTTSEGSKSIEEVEIGELALAYNQDTGKLGFYPVTAIWSHVDSQIVLLRIDNELVTTTPDHPFLTAEDRWIMAGELRVGARVQSISGRYGIVKSITIIRDPQPMYNMTVDIAHTYVVGDGRWVVHNACRWLAGASRASRVEGHFLADHAKWYYKYLSDLGIETRHVTVAVARSDQGLVVTMNGSAPPEAAQAVEALVVSIGGRFSQAAANMHAEVHMVDQFGNDGINTIGVSNRYVCPTCQSYLQSHGYYNVYWDPERKY